MSDRDPLTSAIFIITYITFETMLIILFIPEVFPLIINWIEANRLLVFITLTILLTVLFYAHWTKEEYWR